MKNESQLLKDFKAYIATTGLKAVKVWENRAGVYAQITGFTDKNNPSLLSEIDAYWCHIPLIAAPGISAPYRYPEEFVRFALSP